VNFLVFAIHMSSSPWTKRFQRSIAQLGALLRRPARLRERVLREQGAADAHRTGRGRAGGAFQELASRELSHDRLLVWFQTR
jgi:hypothetical protein